MNNEDVTTLIQQITKGDENAFRNLFNLYYQRLFHVAFYFLKSKELSEEAVSDVFFIIWKKREELEIIKDIERYLYISVKNQALHYIRRSAIPDTEPLELYQIELIPDENNPEIYLMNQEYLELIQKAIHTLPEKCREVFRLVLSDKLKHKEIATLLDISEKTVEAHVATAYKRVAKFVKKEYDGKSDFGKFMGFCFVMA